MATDKSLAELASRLDRIESALLHRVPPFADPSPDDPGRWGGWPWWSSRVIPIPFPGPNPGDPVPTDISRFSRVQLELSLESIKAQRIRLDALEGMIKSQLKQAK
jgi:hypothetical protein